MDSGEAGGTKGKAGEGAITEDEGADEQEVVTGVGEGWGRGGKGLAAESCCGEFKGCLVFFLKKNGEQRAGRRS